MSLFPSIKKAAPLVTTTTSAVAAYLLSRVSLDTFYGNFNLAPAEVGLGYGQIVETSAVFAAALVALSLLTAFWVVGISVLTTRDIISIQNEDADFKEVHPLLLWGYIFLFWYLFLIGIGWAAVHFGHLRHWRFGRSAGTITFAGLLSALTVVFVFLLFQATLASLARSRPRLLWPVLLSALAVTIVIVSVYTARTVGNVEARHVRDGQPVHLSFLVEVLPISAEPVEVRSAVDFRPKEFATTRRCLMFLGQGSGFVILYDVDARAILRMSTGDLILEQTAAARTSCSHKVSPPPYGA